MTRLTPTFRELTWAAFGMLVGIAISLFVLRGVSDISVIFAGLGVLLLVGQVALAYRQSEVETESREEARGHELRVRNEDLFAGHSRQLAELTFVPLQDAVLGDSPGCEVKVVLPDRPNPQSSPVGALWNWSYGRKHILQDHDLGPVWRTVEERLAAFKAASDGWEDYLDSRLRVIIPSSFGPDFRRSENYWAHDAPVKGYSYDLIRMYVRQGAEALGYFTLSERDNGRGVWGLNPGGPHPFIFSDDRTLLNQDRLMSMLRELATDPELLRLRAIEESARDAARASLDATKPILRAFIPRVQLSERVPGDCEICTELKPRISSP
ncbi:MAG: hypothetical protein WBE40_01290 [Thermoplasmata archaeon]